MTASSRFFDRLYVGGLFRPTLRGVACVASVALVVTLAPWSQATPTGAPVVVSAVKVPAAKVASRPDAVSARISARAQGARVEVENLRTEKSSTWVNPDGTWTTEQHQGPIRFKDPKAKEPKTAAWVNVNLDLEGKTDGTAGGVGHPGGLSLAGKTAGAGKGAKGATGSDAVSVDEKSGRTVSMAWPGSLGEPVLKGTTATYPDVMPGVDFVVHSRRTGFESDVVIKTAAARDALLAKAGDGPVAFSFPLKTKGLSARPNKDGSISFVDAKNTVVSSFAAPTAWDAKVDPDSGNRVNETPAALTVLQQNPGHAFLTVTPDREWLAAADRQFPITIDPTYASGSAAPTFDTFVSTSWGSSTTPQTMTELRVGTYNGGGDVAYSYLNFPVSGMSGKDITSSNLSLFEFHSNSCTASPVTAHRSAAAGTGTTWSNQPAVTTLAGSLSVAKGFSSSCAAARIQVPITPVAQAWASEGATSGTLRLSASTTNNSGWKKFHSMEASYDPVISYSYNRKPNAAVTPSIPDANPYTPPGGSGPLPFVNDTTPKLSSTATDPDGSTVSMTFEVHKDTTGNTKVTSCATALVASGAAATCSVPTLAEVAPAPGIPVYYARAAVKDERGLWNGTWSPWRGFYVQTTAPPAPVVACDNGYATSGTWTDTDPAGTVTCQIKASGIAGTFFTPAYLNITVDGVVWPQKTIALTNDPTVVHATATFAATARGYHEVKVTALGRSLVGSTTTHGFGWGAASMAVPTDGTTSSGKVKVDATGPPTGSTSTTVSAKVQWRVAGSGNETTGWTDAAAGATPITPNPIAVPAQFKNKVFDLTTAIHEAGASVDIPLRTPVRLDVQVCFVYGGSGAGTQCTWSQSPVTVTRLPHAFGAGYPVADAGVGQLAQYTGEVSLSGTDVSVPGYTGDISISRSHTSFAGDGSVANWPSDAVTGVFGPGFTANLDGGEAGLAGLTVVDNTRIDGSLVFMDEDGEPLVYTNPNGTRTYPAAPNATGTVYDAGTDDTADSGTLLKLTGSGTDTVLTLTEEDGTATTWKPVGDPTTASAAVWKPDTISEPGQSGKTTFGHDITGRVTRIVAPVPDGMAGTSCTTTGALAKGCRALDLIYEASVNGLPWRVKEVKAQLWNPATSAMATTSVATYLYDASGRLIKVTDPRSNLGTTYTWSGTTTRIASIASANMAATKLTYDTGGRLTKVSKEAPVAGGADVVTSRFVYGVPTSGSGLPTVSDADTAYLQKKAPVTGFASFGQDYTGPDTPTSADWAYANLSYVDDLGYTVNTATYGANAWLITSSDYDANDNVIRTLDASAATTARAMTTANPTISPALVDAMSTQTLYNPEEKNAAGDVIVPAGSQVSDTFAPERLVALASGQQVSARPHTHTTYDEGAPNAGINPATAQRYSLTTKETRGVSDSAAAANAADLEVYSTTTSGYGKLNTGDATEGDGWALGVATRTTTVNPTDAAANIVTTTRYDSMGRVTETRHPLSTGADAGTTKTAYYTATGAAPCGGKPEWAGLACRTYPAVQPTSGPTLPDSWTSAYSMWLKPATELETSGTSSRTTTTAYDPALVERPIWSKVVASGIAGQSSATARPGTFTKYDATTGQVTYTGALNAAKSDAETAGRTTSTYDRWGRTLTQTGDAGLVTTTYDSAGRVSTVTDAKGITTYGYDGIGERRGLTTSLTISRGGTAGSLTYGATYDADGNMTKQSMPGKITQVTKYDEAGEAIELQYLGQVTPVTETNDPVTGETTWTPGTPVQDQPWLGWSTVNDGAGRARFEATGTGAAFDNGNGVATIDEVTDWTAVGQASSYGREYRYDFAGRLTSAQDAASALNTDQELVASCTTRAYTFDKNGRRTQLATTTRNGGDCATTGTTTTFATTGYDAADRPTTGKGSTGTYVYDTFGRQTTLPSVDAPDTTKGNITLGYFDDDQPRSVTQDTTSTTFTLDANGRRSVQTTIDPSGTTTTTRKYTDGGDNPAWIDTTSPTGSSTTRFTESLGGDLSATINTDGGLTISLANPHGDVVTGVDIPAAQADTTPATAITGWATYDEYGNKASTTDVDAVDGPLGYGWLGAKQRSTSDATAGLTLMGVRFYNAARGLFTSLDPVPGGNDTAYNYPNDPINQTDTDGQWRKPKTWGATWTHTKTSARLMYDVGSWATLGRWKMGKRAWKYRSWKRAKSALSTCKSSGAAFFGCLGRGVGMADIKGSVNSWRSSYRGLGRAWRDDISYHWNRRKPAKSMPKPRGWYPQRSNRGMR